MTATNRKPTFKVMGINPESLDSRGMVMTHFHTRKRAEKWLNDHAAEYAAVGVRMWVEEWN